MADTHTHTPRQTSTLLVLLYVAGHHPTPMRGDHSAAFRTPRNTFKKTTWRRSTPPTCATGLLLCSSVPYLLIPPVVRLRAVVARGFLVLCVDTTASTPSTLR